MEDKTIKLLYINSKVHALININQAPAGETGVGAVTQPIAAGSTFFITMLPLENEKNFVYLPYTRRISIAKNGNVFSNDSLIDLCIWPDNIVELTLYPQAVYKSEDCELYPSVLAPFEFYISGEKHTAFIYNEAYSSFAVEHGATNRLKFISPLPFFVTTADISFTKLGNYPIIYASGKTNKDESFIYVASILPSFHSSICSLCEKFSVTDNCVSVIKNGDYRQEKTRYENTGDALAPVLRELGWFTVEAKQPSTPEELCADLLQAVRADLQDAAMSCLTPSLADGLSFADLKEFFGDFAFYTPTLSPACGENSIALKYKAGENLYAARVFCIETKKVHGTLLIDNIREP